MFKPTIIHGSFTRDNRPDLSRLPQILLHQVAFSRSSTFLLGPRLAGLYASGNIFPSLCPRALTIKVIYPSGGLIWGFYYGISLLGVSVVCEGVCFPSCWGFHCRFGNVFLLG